MPQQIKVFSDKSVLVYDKGLFDQWCVYLTRPNIARYPPKDVEYFTRLKQLGLVYTNQMIYNDYARLYDRTTAKLEPAVLDFITELTAPYAKDSLEMDILFSILYAGMIAEENKENSRLGKRIKRLGVHQILLEDMDSASAANFSKRPQNYQGSWWGHLDGIMKERGF